MMPSVPKKIQPPLKLGWNGSVFSPRVSETMVLSPKSKTTTWVLGVWPASRVTEPPAVAEDGASRAR